MAELVVYVHLLETKTGEWCPSCLLPSAITVITAISTKKNEPPRRPMMTKTWCADCGREC
jgi:hypothetical protein